MLRNITSVLDENVVADPACNLMFAASCQYVLTCNMSC